MNTRKKDKKEKNNIDQSKERKSREGSKGKQKNEEGIKKNTSNSKTKKSDLFKDKKIKDAFLLSNKTALLKKKSEAGSKSKESIKNIPNNSSVPARFKRSRKERSQSKKKENSEGESEEEIPNSLEIKTVKIQKRKKAVKEDNEEEEENDEGEIEEVTVSKISKSKKAKKENISKKSKSVPTKKNKKSQVADGEIESEPEDVSDEENNKKSKSKKKKSENQSKSKKRKSYTSNLRYSKGKENPNVGLVFSCKYLESKEPNLLEDCCIQCNNRNLIRAVKIGNAQLFKKSIEAKNTISSLNDEWSTEFHITPIELAILRGDKSMISELITHQINFGKTYDRVNKPNHKLAEVDTGESSEYAYGVRTRKLNMTRGNRIGNNAFLDDSNKANDFNDVIMTTVMQKCKDPKLIDYITAAFIDPLKDNSFGAAHIDFNSRLNLAVGAGNRVIAHFLLERMIKTNVNGNYGYNQLHFNVLDYKDDKFDVSHRASLNKKNIGSTTTLTPVSVACINPNEKILQRLIDLGADYHFADFNGYKPIHYAAACEGPGPLRLLLSLGSRVDEPTKDKTTPLIIACRYGRLENVKLLLKSKANALHKSKKGNAALNEAAEFGHGEVVKTLLLHEGIVIDFPGKDKMTPLIIAAAHGHRECVNILLDSGAKILKKDKFKRTALLMACKSGQTVIASILLRRGSQFNLPDSSSNSPLHYACAYGWMEIVKLLLQAGANANSTNMWKISSLEVALLKNHFGIVKFLLNNSQVDVNMKFDKGNTLLHHSFKKMTEKSISEIEYLLGEKKADPNIQNIEGRTCMHLLAEYNFNEFKSVNAIKGRNFGFGHNEEISQGIEAKLKLDHANIINKIFQILKTNGALIDLKTIEEKCPLQTAIEKRNYLMIELILDSNPDVLFVDSNNTTILHLLSDLVFDEEGEQSLRKIVDVILNNPGIDKFVNLVDDKGLTPILKLFYIYSKNVKQFYGIMHARESKNFKSEIYKQSLNLEKNANPNKEANNVMIQLDEANEENIFKGLDSEIPSSSFPVLIRRRPVLGKVAIKHGIDSEMSSSESSEVNLGRTGLGKVAIKHGIDSEMSSSEEHIPPRWTGLGKVAIKYGIDSSDKETEAKKINKIVLTEEDTKIVWEKTKEKFFDYIHNIFNNIVFSFIKIGCDVHAQVQKTKKWRDRKPGEIIKEEAEQLKNTQMLQPLTNAFGFGMSAPAKKSARRNAIAKPKNTSQNRIRHDVANEYHDGVGLSNIIMLLMTFPVRDLLKHLVEELKVDINSLDIFQQNSLVHLIKNHSLITEISPDVFKSTIDSLLKYNIKVNQFDRDGNSLFFMMSKLWELEEMAKLYNHGADINKMNKKGENALIHYIRKKDKYKVELLLKNFIVDINYRDDKMRTALHYLYNDEESSADIDVSLKQIILSKNPDVNVKDIMRRTPLHYLFVKIGKEFDKSQIDPIVALSTLLDIRGIEIDAQDIFGNTPLHYASQRGATICAMSLIHNTDINTKNYEGNTPLGYALLYKQPNFSIVLIQQSAYIYDNVHPLVERNEEEMIRKERKTNKLLSNSLLSFDLNTYSINNMLDFVTTDRNIKLDELNKSASDCSDNSDIDEEDEDEECDNTYIAQPYFNQNPFGSGNGFNFNNYTNMTQNSQKHNPNLKQLNDTYFYTEEDKAKGISLFRMCVKNEYQGLTYLFVNQGYDLMKAIQDAFYENKFNLAMLLLDKSPYDEIYRSTNEKGQNLFHILALFGKSVENKRELNLFFDKLSEKGVDLILPDVNGYTPIHYACENHFEDLFEYIFNKNQTQNVLNAYTHSGYTPFICSIKGGINISKSFKHLELILHKIDKKQISILYSEEHYGESYKCTPLLHATRSFLDKSYKTDPILTEEGKKIVKLVQYGASVMEKDSNGLDCLMHCVKENNMKLLELFVKNCKTQIVDDAIDFYGRSLVHYAVSPLEEGSYENENLLSYLIENGFATHIKDINGKTPYDYAAGQETATNLKVLKRYKVAPQDVAVLGRKKSIILSNEWPESFADFEKDAEEFYQKMSSQLSLKQEIKILPDPNGNFPEDTHDVIKDDSCGFWDIIMTKVKVGAGLYGEYNFYKMQLIHDKGRDVFILWNRFGRIGEVGQYQRTPFNTLQEAQSEFKKIFKSKSGNEWEHKSNFKRITGKYMLLHISEWKVSHKDLLEAFDYKKSPKSKICSKEIKSLIKNMTNSAIYYKALRDCGIDTDLLNFTYLNKDLIFNARSILGKINKIQQDITDIRQKKNSSGHYDENIVSKVLEMKNEIYELSSRYYELIPKSKFKNTAVTALDNDKELKEEILLLENLTYVEKAVKILLAAQFRQKEINPIDYCLNSMNILIDVIDRASNEFNLLNKYISQNADQNLKILNIFKIQRKGEAENVEKMSIPNHLLLFHGSKVFNYIGILSNGLKVAPPEAPVTGYMYGKGVYFADMFEKSYAYCDSFECEDDKGKKKKQKYMLMCEVALGKVFEVGLDNSPDQELAFLKDGFNSLKARATKEIDPTGKFVMNNGVAIPLGKIINTEVDRTKHFSLTSLPEYVVYDESQIRMRYLIQIED